MFRTLFLMRKRRFLNVACYMLHCCILPFGLLRAKILCIFVYELFDKFKLMNYIWMVI